MLPGAAHWLGRSPPEDRLDIEAEGRLRWANSIHAEFRRVGMRQVGYVPDAGHSRLIELCVSDPKFTMSC